MQSPTLPFGSFREKVPLLPTLPESIAALRTVHENDWKQQFSLQKDASHLNHGAFGSVPVDFQVLETELRRLAEANPSYFYDKLCIPLLRESVQEASTFFNGTVILQVNCTVAMKGVLTMLCKDPATVIGVLEPIYGATRKLVSTMTLNEQAVVISPGFFNEDAESIVVELEAAYTKQPFHILVADRVTSQSGRLLPLREVINWCSTKGVISVVDGTQDFVFDNEIWPDYFVMSTHKWLCNVKTCAVVRMGAGTLAPEPVGVSFGYPHSVDQHIWTGMMDYIPYIMLAKALRVYRVHGARMVQYASCVLQRGLAILNTNDNTAATTSVGVSAAQSTSTPNRVMAMVEVFRLLQHEDLQEALESYGVFVSVKELDGRKYLRLSAWTYNSLSDFHLLRDFLNHRIRLNYGEVEDTSLSTSLPTVMPLSMEERSNRKRSQILYQFNTSLDIEDRMYEQLLDAGFFVRAEALRHPLIFYYGHVAVFYINKLIMGGYLSYEDRICPDLESLCAVGVDEMAWDDLWLGNWDKVPASEYSAKLNSVRSYRDSIRRLVSSVISNAVDTPLSLPIEPTSVWWIILMGLEHSRIHLETTAAILTQMPLQYFTKGHTSFPVAVSQQDRSCVRANTLVPVKGGYVCAGKTLVGAEYFGWDNEFGIGKDTHLNDFEVSAMLVSNAEYASFVDEGGYTTRSYWSKEGWGWVSAEGGAGSGGRTRPMLWDTAGDGEGGELSYRLLSSKIPMPYDWPVAVTNFEAEAFCAWKSVKLGKTVKLISHIEWLLLAKRSSESGCAEYNSNFRHYASPCGVDVFGSPVGKSTDTTTDSSTSSIVYDVCGNLWQHSRSPLTVLEEFAVHPVYDDFTLPTIDGHHSFILGGSFMSTGNLGAIDARYGFRKHFFQFAGIRYVVSDNEDIAQPAKVYEGDVSMQLMEHFTEFTDKTHLSIQPVPNGVAEYGVFASQYINEHDTVIVLNGSVGRVSMEIACNANPSAIIHTDGTANALDAFLQLQTHSVIRYDRRIEGLISKTETVSLSTAFRAALLKTDISVKQLDLFRLIDGSVPPQDVAVVDLTMLSAMNCLHRGDIPPNLHVLVKPGGKLIVLRPATANRHACDEALFPGFVRVDIAEELTGPSTSGSTADGTKAKQIAHICRETRRKHRFSVSECMVFERTSEVIDVAADNAVNSDFSITPQYEQTGVLEAYERFHFKFKDIYGIKNFPQACAEVCLEACARLNVCTSLAMDCGCGPGRLGSDLASTFDQVVSYDLANGFVEMAQRYAPANMTATLGDAMNFHKDPLVQGRKFNLIVGANLVDRVPDPTEWVRRSTELLADDGILVIFTPFTWLREYSDQDKWFGGFRKDAEVVWSLIGATAAVAPDLCLRQAPTHVPFVIPDADGTFQYTYSQCMVFGRKNTSASPLRENFLPDIALNYSSPV